MGLNGILMESEWDFNEISWDFTESEWDFMGLQCDLMEQKSWVHNELMGTWNSLRRKQLQVQPFSQLKHPLSWGGSLRPCFRTPYTSLLLLVKPPFHSSPTKKLCFLSYLVSKFMNFGNINIPASHHGFQCNLMVEWLGSPSSSVWPPG